MFKTGVMCVKNSEQFFHFLQTHIKLGTHRKSLHVFVSEPSLRNSDLSSGKENDSQHAFSLSRCNSLGFSHLISLNFSHVMFLILRDIVDRLL